MAQPRKRNVDRKRRNETDHPVHTLAWGTPEADELPFEVDLDPRWPTEDDELRPDGTFAGAEAWHPLAKLIWNRLKTDPSALWTGGGQMALNAVMCENLTRLLNDRPIGVIPASEHGEGRVEMGKVPINGAEMTGLMRWLERVGVGEKDRLSLYREIDFYAAVARKEADKPLAPVHDIHRSREAALADG